MASGCSELLKGYVETVMSGYDFAGKPAVKKVEQWVNFFDKSTKGYRAHFYKYHFISMSYENPFKPGEQHFPGCWRDPPEIPMKNCNKLLFG